MAKKKVLFVATVDSHIESFHLPFLKMFKNRGYEVHVAANTKRPIKYCDKKICLPIKRSPFKLISNLKATRQLREVMKREKYEIVHCHTPVGGVVARLAGKKVRRHGTRMIYTAHGFHFYAGAPLRYWLMFYPVEWYLAKYTDTLITINDEDFKRAGQKFGKRCRDIQYVPGVGVDPEKFDKKITNTEKTRIRRRLGLSDDDYVIIFPAELSERKNQMWLIKTLLPVFRDGINKRRCRLLLPGKDSLGGRCQRFARENGVEESILFLGPSDNIPELLLISDVAVSSSNQEGLPVNLIEAAFARLPIVATDCRGNRDVCRVVGRQNSIIVKIGDGDGFISGIKKCVKKNREEYDNKEIINKCSNKTIGKMLSEIYFKRKRVLHLLASKKFSGAENMACMICKGMCDEFEMLYCSPKGPIQEALKKRNIKYYGVDKMRLKNIKEVIEEFVPDVIHAHDYRASLLASRFSHRATVVSHIHQNNPRVRVISFSSLAFLVTSARVEKIIWVSEEAFCDYCFHNILKKRSVILRNIVDQEYIRAKSKEYEVNGKYDLIFLGRLVKLKNPRRALNILRIIKDQKSDIKMAIVGSGPEHSEVVRDISEYGLEDNVEMFGFIANPYPILAHSKILLITSEREGVPMAILEAQALGKPVVGTKIRGLDKQIKDAVNGFLSDDDQSMASTILKYLGEENYSAMTKQVSDDFYKQNNSRRYFDCIRKIYNDKGLEYES